MKFWVLCVFLFVLKRVLESKRMRWRKSREKDMETERLQKETQSILCAQENNTEEYDVIELKISDT